jgi:hypothetical protein
LQEAKQRASQIFLKQRGVFAVAAGQDDRGAPAIVVYVSAALPSGEIPDLPSSFDGYPVKVVIADEPAPL